MTGSGGFLQHSLHLILFQWVPCALPDAIVRAFLATNSFAMRAFTLWCPASRSPSPRRCMTTLTGLGCSSAYACQQACISKSVPRDIISLIGCYPQLPRSAVGMTRISRGWLLSVPFLRSSCSLGFLRFVLMTPCQSGVPLMRCLKVLFTGLFRCIN